jgi:hypothetical protein
MAKLVVATVYDVAVGAYLQPFFTRSRGEAIRTFVDACSDAKHQFAKYPADYILMYLGEFDDQSGTVESVTPFSLLTALDAVFRAETDSSGK